MDTLFTIENTTTEGSDHIIAVSLNPSHAIFEGHFPEKPILPGVCTLEIIKRAIAHSVGSSLRYEAIADCKYLALIEPEKDQHLILRMNVIQADDQIHYTVKGAVWSGDQVKLKLKSTMIML